MADPVLVCVWAPVAPVDAAPREVVASGGVAGFLLRYYVWVRTPAGPAGQCVAESWAPDVAALLAAWAQLGRIPLIGWRAREWLATIFGVEGEEAAELQATLWERTFDPLDYWKTRFDVERVVRLADLFAAAGSVLFEPSGRSDPRAAWGMGDFVTAWAMTRSVLQSLAQVVSLGALSAAGRVPSNGLDEGMLGFGLGNPGRENPTSPDASPGRGGVAPFLLPSEDWWAQICAKRGS